MANAAILVFANKQDLPGALSPAEVSQQLGLDQVLGRNRQWCIQKCSAVEGTGLTEGLDWYVVVDG